MEMGGNGIEKVIPAHLVAIGLPDLLFNKLQRLPAGIHFDIAHDWV